MQSPISKPRSEPTAGPLFGTTAAPASVKAAVPTTITTWLSAELDKKLASLPTEQQRFRCLIEQGNAWCLRYGQYRENGSQPYGGPHPKYGAMNHFDFAILLADIEQRKAALIGKGASC